MAEGLAPAHDPNHKHLNLYKEWARGGWGMLLTGLVTLMHSSSNLSNKLF
jgi:2,4-dienoyl-CoA reductase-like NADH-dependent reductase (Old Yellow Enzyme family)